MSAIEQAGIGEDLAIGRCGKAQRVSGGGLEHVEELAPVVGRAGGHAPSELGEAHHRPAEGRRIGITGARPFDRLRDGAEQLHEAVEDRPCRRIEPAAAAAAGTVRVDAPLDAAAHRVRGGLDHGGDQHVLRRLRGLVEDLIYRRHAALVVFPLDLLDAFIHAITLEAAVVMGQHELRVALLDRPHQAAVIDHLVLRAVLEILVDPQPVQTVAVAVHEFGEKVVDPIVVGLRHRLVGVAVEEGPHAALAAFVEQVA